MQFVIDKINNYSGLVFKNIIRPQYAESVFNDLTADKSAKKFALELSLSDAEITQRDTVQFNAIEYVFRQKSWLASRFCDGTYPTWYGSTRLETTFYETVYHWHRTFIQSPMTFSAYTKPIKVPRSVYSVSCNAILIDLCKKHKDHPELVDKNISSYNKTQPIGKYIRDQGFSGIMSLSCRHKTGQNIVLFRKEVLSDACHQDDYYYTYYPNGSKIVINEIKNNKEILSVPIAN